MAIPHSRIDVVVLFFLLIILSHLQLTLGASKKCFNGSGDQTNHLPCRPDSQADGPCCAPGDICLSNNLCKLGPKAERNTSIDTDTYRPNCTDQNWDAENCFSGCNDFAEPLVQSCYDNRYCCYASDGCDCGKTSLFEMDPATFVTTLPLSMPLAITKPARNSATTTTTSATAASQTGPSGSSPSETASSGPSQLGIAVGAGVASALAVIIIAGVATCFFLRRRKTQHPAELGSIGGERRAHMMPLVEVDGRSKPQEVGYSAPHEMDGNDNFVNVKGDRDSKKVWLS